MTVVFWMERLWWGVHVWAQTEHTSESDGAECITPGELDAFLIHQHKPSKPSISHPLRCVINKGLEAKGWSHKGAPPSGWLQHNLQVLTSTSGTCSCFSAFIHSSWFTLFIVIWGLKSSLWLDCDWTDSLWASWQGVCSGAHWRIQKWTF